MNGLNREIGCSNEVESGHGLIVRYDAIPHVRDPWFAHPKVGQQGGEFKTQLAFIREVWLAPAKK